MSDTFRDVLAYGARADGYERGPRGALHREIARRVAVLAAGEALRVAGGSARILDVGCGTGALLRFAGALLPGAALAGVDLAPEMVRVARATGVRGVVEAGAERLPFPSGAFDVVVSSTSFSHWADREAGLAECHRVLAEGGVLVLADVFGGRGLPERVFGPGGRGGSAERAEAGMRAAGFREVGWRAVFAGVIRAGVGVR